MGRNSWRDGGLENVRPSDLPELEVRIKKEVPRWGICKQIYPEAAIKTDIIRRLCDVVCKGPEEISLVLAFLVSCMGPTMMKDFMYNLNMMKDVRRVCDAYGKEKNGS